MKNIKRERSRSRSTGNKKCNKEK